MLLFFKKEVLPVFLALSAQSAAAAPLSDISAYVASVRHQFNVPGVAIAIVKDGNIVFEHGYGDRNIATKAPVDAHTAFCIASITKTFTATAIEMLADASKLNTNDRVIDHLPWFKMAEPYVTHEIRIADLLEHRTGLSPHGGDLLINPPTDYSLRDVVAHLAHVPLPTGFRAGFAYDNIMFAVASLIIEQASGQSYADYITTHIFQPLGMRNARIDGATLQPGDNYATAYRPIDATLRAMPILVWKNDPGAAGIYASADDMAKWMQVQLAGGRIKANGASTQLFSKDRQDEMWSMATPIDIETPNVPGLAIATPNFLGYGMGWFMSDYRGHRTVWHTGGFPGTVSAMTLIPDAGLGVIVLTNQESDEAQAAITRHIVDAYLGAPAHDWIAAYAAQAHNSAVRIQQSEASVKAHKPVSGAITYIVGRYHDAWYGDVFISNESGKLRIHFTHTPNLAGTLTAWSSADFLVRWDNRLLNADAVLHVRLSSNGLVRGATLQRASAITTPAFDYEDLTLTR